MRVRFVQSLLCFAAVAAGMMADSPCCSAQERRAFLLIDRDLRADTVELARIEDGWVECLRSGLIDRRPTEDLLALLRLDEVESSRFEAGDRVVELVDGQRWVGAPAPGGAPDQLAWKIDRIGLLSAPLEQVRRARLLPRAALPALGEHEAEERLILANGDALSGLLVSLGEEVVFEVSGSAEATRLPLRQVASLALANPAQRPEGLMLWLADGSVVKAKTCRWTSGTLEFTTATGGLTCRVEADMLRGMSFAAQRLMPLAALSPRLSRDSANLCVVEPPRLVDPDRAVGLADVELRGPIEARYDLPRGATRFAATAIVPRYAAQWADLHLSILLDDRIVFEGAMDGAGHSRREIALELDGASSLAIRIGEGGRGPVQDVILLQRPMLLFD